MKDNALYRWEQPSLFDLSNGPLECRFRDSDAQAWKYGYLTALSVISNDFDPFFCSEGVTDPGDSAEWFPSCEIRKY